MNIKNINIVVTMLTSLTLVFLIQPSLAQTGRNQPITTQDVNLVKVIKNCYVPYLDTKKLYAVVVSSSVSSSEGAVRTDKPRSIIKGKPNSANDQVQTMQQTNLYPISPEVEVRENGRKGLVLNIKTIAGIGFITKADIHVMKNEVVKIIIIDLQQ